ncbi:MAG TPA: YidB family protein [Burkholderiales bacterium]|nr:YidB family protein [Burkholderiales bacterium]
MGLLDQLVGAASKLGGQSAQTDNPLLNSVLQLVNNPQTGGLPGLVESFRKGGLTEAVNSWVSTGGNIPITAEQIQSVLGNEKIQKLAGKLGISTDQLSVQLAETLPQVIDKLTPNGKIPESGELLAKGMELLKGKL